MGRKYSDVKPEQGEVLEALENLSGKKIKSRKRVKWDETGYQTDHDEVVQLNLNSMGLNKLPDNFGNLESLQTLFLNNNSLVTLPESFGQLKSLQLLALGENKLKTLPNSFINLTSLKECWLNGNFLGAIPKDIGNLKALEELNLEHNRLTEIPESIGKFSFLQSLDLSHNQLTTIPDSIGKLKNLELLDLEKNKLEWIPETLGNLKLLAKLDLSNNKLKAIPGFIDNLKALKTLDLRQNQLKTLPGNLWRLQNLTELRITGNPLVDEWRKLKSKGTEAILNYCREVGSVNVFMSYSVSDYQSGKYPIDEIAHQLKEEDEISYVYHCMQDMKKDGQIDKFMNQTIPHCQFVLFIATKNSLQSQACLHELAVTGQHHLKIIPILCDNITWDNPSLQKAGLTREFGLELRGHEVKKLTNELYDHILQYKQKHNVFTKEEAEIKVELFNIKRSIVNFLESPEFDKILKPHMADFRRIFQQLSEMKISPKKYFLECAEIIAPSKKPGKTDSKKIDKPRKPKEKSSGS